MVVGERDGLAGGENGERGGGLVENVGDGDACEFHSSTKGEK